MPEMNRTRRVDYTDLGDDDIRAIEDEKLREALYRVTAKIKLVLEYQENLISDLYEAVTDIEQQP